MSTKTFPIQKESENRHRIMSNPEIKYLYSKRTNVIHDKHCDSAKTIADEELGWSEEYIAALYPCPACMLRAYIAAGAKDLEEMERYLQFFEKTRMTDEQIRSIYIECGMKTRIFHDTMTIWYKEDTWRIRTLPKKGHVQLYHNNYAVRKGGIREFTQGFHIQNISCEDTNIQYALSIIKNYEYRPEESDLHRNSPYLAGKEKVRQKQPDAAEKMALPLEEMLEDRSNPKSVWQRIKEFFHSMFKKKSLFQLHGFELVSEHGYPADQTICVYIWKDKNNRLLWQTGIYNKKMKQIGRAHV